ncbi:two-component system response regulator [Nostoc sp. 'Peltigera membranacea cyanobiont' 213]|uniref:response regulator n=1 Tax=unclassified Nostoc TaxID=2593658 RepID=UPI000B9515C0|nr:MULTISPECIES: response regulator [unclassified Nostoc]AVH63285.1 response regulator receiver protein [Nostoc sp. 'Peltigera membranacea cyanobiont' N6]OYD97189.1 two-component system response regulator [Nostoc sp. 'Peltigera membranacea cyanobiont' 213]
MTSISASPVQQTPLLLVVEDSNEDFEALQRFLKRSSIPILIERCVNGEQALAFLYRTGSYINRENAPRPGLIVLDLNLPGTDGREVLRRIKLDDNLKRIPVVVFTTSNNPKDIEVCYQYGVNSYIVKPINFAQLKRDIQMLVEYWFEVTTLPDYLDD